jgi:hypothetical protein
MPVACNQSQLTGQDGLVMFKPAGTEHCLLDFTDFGPAGDTQISVPLQHDFRLGDPVVFSVEGAAQLDTAFAVGTTYFVRAVGEQFVTLSASLGGVAIQMEGDGGQTGSGVASAAFAVGFPGAGYANGTYTGVQLVQGVNNTARARVTVTAGVPVISQVTTPGLGYTNTVGSLRLAGGNDGNGNTITAVTPTQTWQGTPTLTTRSDSAGAHVNIEFASYAAVCQVESFQINMTRSRIETTSIPCKVGGGASKYAAFRTYQAGFADGTGSMSIKFTEDTTSLANRLLANSMLRSQSGAWVKLYISAVAAAGSSVPDDPSSLYIEAPISLEGMDVNLTSSGDTPTTATVNFSVSGLPKHLFSIDLF